MDVLNDIENDIDGDWGDIFDKVEKENELEAIKDPIIPNFPLYEEFYQCLLNCLHHNDSMSTLPVEFLHMAHKITQSRDMDKPSNSFNEVWNFFCDPNRYRTERKKCDCGADYKIILKRSFLGSDYSIREVINSRPSFGVDMMYQEVSIKRKCFYCPECGKNFVTLLNEELVGLFKD